MIPAACFDDWAFCLVDKQNRNDTLHNIVNKYKIPPVPRSAANRQVSITCQLIKKNRNCAFPVSDRDCRSVHSEKPHYRRRQSKGLAEGICVTLFGQGTGAIRARRPGRVKFVDNLILRWAVNLIG